MRKVSAEDWPHGSVAAVDLALLARYYERFADHTVSIANRGVYLATGERPEGGTLSRLDDGSARDCPAPRPETPLPGTPRGAGQRFVSARATGQRQIAPSEADWTSLEYLASTPRVYRGASGSQPSARASSSCGSTSRSKVADPTSRRIRSPSRT